MQISNEQKQLIDSLWCERLSSNEKNLRQVGDFLCQRNELLASALQNEAFEDDECGSTAYYLVKDKKDGNILFYFSLKSGVLYDQHIDEKSIKIVKKINLFVQDIVSQLDLTSEQKKAVAKFLEKVRTHQGVSIEDIKLLPQKNEALFKELEAELNHEIAHVGKTYSGIELVHFCKNNSCDDIIRAFGLPRNFGEIVFWKFIVPKIVEARERVGIQYFFLFAADMSKERKLIQYYSDFLHFKEDDERTTVMPVYDFACKFMYQPVSELNNQAAVFWNYFNPDDEV